MERSSKLMLLAMCLYTLSLVEYNPAFAPTASSMMQTRIPTSLRGAGGAKSASTTSLASGLRSAAALAAVSAAAMSVRGSRAQARSRVQLKVTTSPIIVYCCALNQGAVKHKEAVQVAQDMMRIKNCFQDREWLMDQDDWINDEECEGPKRVEKLIEVCGPFQSTVVPKFIGFLNKKLRLEQLHEIAVEYVKDLYIKQDIAPVLCTTATPLSDQQKDAIYTKMKAKTGCADVKLQCKCDPTILGGVLLEWEFQDPDKMKYPIYSINSTLSKYIDGQALKAGVVM